MKLIVRVWLAVTALLSLVAADDSEAAGQFFNPPDAVDGTHDYSTNPIYALNDKQTIKFTTVYQNYKIDLWQQHPHEDEATGGPTVFRKSNRIVRLFGAPSNLRRNHGRRGDSVRLDRANISVRPFVLAHVLFMAQIDL